MGVRRWAAGVEAWLAGAGAWEYSYQPSVSAISTRRTAGWPVGRRCASRST